MLIKRDILNHLKDMTATVIVFFHAVITVENELLFPPNGEIPINDIPQFKLPTINKKRKKEN